MIKFLYDKGVLILVLIICIFCVYIVGRFIVKKNEVKRANVKLSLETKCNNLLGAGQDPWVIHTNSYYYYCSSENGSITLRKSQKLGEITDKVAQAVFTPPAGTEYSKNLWAPELHWLEGKWYIYFAADDGDNSNHRMYVLEGGSDPNDPLNGAYKLKGKITDSTDKWAIDGTIVTYKGKNYFCWSGWKGIVNVAQYLYIAPMSNPWTISGERVEISQPEYLWELNGNPQINEGPQALYKDGVTHIIYSASGSWTDDYCLGQLTLTGDNILDKASWTKKDEPVFKKTDYVFGPGHASFVKSPDGKEDWIVYHAARAKGSGWDRNIRIQKFTWNGTEPYFGEPIAPNTEIPAPSGE